MKVQKTTSIICLSGAVISGVLMALFLYRGITDGGVTSGIFTGFVVSFIVSLAAYFHEKAALLEKTRYMLVELFMSLDVMQKKVGMILPNIYCTYDMTKLKFDQIREYTLRNVGYIQDSGLAFFHPFFSKSRVASVYKNLPRIKCKISRMSVFAYDIEVKIADCTINLLAYQQRGVSDPSMDGKISECKNTITIWIAKFHEYTAILLKDLDEEIGSFYETLKCRQSWQAEKELLNEAVNDIVGDKK